MADRDSLQIKNQQSKINNRQSTIVNQQSSINNRHSTIVNESCIEHLLHLGCFSTTEIYLHVATGVNGLGVVSPLDVAA